MNIQNSDIIRLIDLTRLDSNDDSNQITALCQQAQTTAGNVAAVCVFPQFISTAKKNLMKTDIAIATVANFPEGTHTLNDTLKQIKHSLENGAQEIDVVLPYPQFIAHDDAYVDAFLRQCRAETSGATLKIIIESGALNNQQITLATQKVAAANADFVKTSTGKIPQGATLADVETILQTLSTLKNPPGIKISGGVRTPEQARDYLTLIARHMGDTWITSQQVRIGASQLLDRLL